MTGRPALADWRARTVAIRRLGPAMTRVAPAVLAIAAEAAWITAVAGLFQEYVLRDPVLSIPDFAAFVVLGVLASRLLTRRLGDRWPAVAIALVGAASAAGVVIAPDARAALTSGGLGAIGRAAAAHPGGLLAGAAVLRGFAHGRGFDDDRIGRLFRGGVIVIAFAGLAGSLVADPWRQRFLVDVLDASLVFAATGILALALSRENGVGLESGVDWRRNPAWVGLLVLLVMTVVVLAVPVSAMAPRTIELAFGVALAFALGPLLVIGLIAGWTRRAVVVLLIALAIDGLAILLRRFSSSQTQTAPTAISSTPTAQGATAIDQGVVLIGAVIVGSLVVLGALLLIRLWMRQASIQPADVDEVRTIDRGDRSVVGEPRWRWPSFALRRSPTDAVEAYRALIHDLATRPAVRREPAETPAEHAQRLRAAGLAGLSLELLAADYALVRFGGLSLSASEHRRAVARWRDLRRHLTGPPAPATSPRRPRG